MKKIISIISFLFIGIFLIHAQTKTDVIDVDNFKASFLESLIVDKINSVRKDENIRQYEEQDFLKKTAADQTKHMITYNLVEETDAGSRAMLYGGTRNVVELIGKASVKIGADDQTYEQVADYILDYNKGNAKKAELLFTPKHYYIGVAVSLDEAKKKVYYTITLGNIKSEAPQMDETWSKFIGAKTFGLYYEDEETCKKCQRFKNINELVDNMVVEDGQIYFIYNDYKKLMRLLKDGFDGLAVDVVQRDQFPCGATNKINYVLPYKGILLKPLYLGTLIKKNEFPNEAENKIKVNMGEMPEGIDPANCELNLVVIIDKYVCRNLYRNYVEKPTKQTYSYDIMLLKDPKNNNSQPISTADIDEAYQKQMCYRANNYSFKNYQNKFNCSFTKLRLPKTFTESDASAVGADIDNMKLEGKIEASVLQMMEIEMVIRVLEEVNKDEEYAIDRLRNMNLKNLDIQLAQTLFYILMEHDEYDLAMELFSQYYMKEGVDENILFSFITNCTLTPDWLQSNAFIESMKIAETLNHDRFCNLISDDKLSFQIFESLKVKKQYCKSCGK